MQSSCTPVAAFSTLAEGITTKVVASESTSGLQLKLIWYTLNLRIGSEPCMPFLFIVITCAEESKLQSLGKSVTFSQSEYREPNGSTQV